MSDEKIVILARPHPFIAKHMKPFLIENGFTPFPIEGRSDIAKIANRLSVKGAIVSTSVLSADGGSYVDDFNFIREEFDGLPIAFATLGHTAEMLGPIKSAIATDDLNPTILEVTEANKFNAAIGSDSGFLLIHKNDVAETEAKPLTAAMLAKHFAT